MSFIERMMDKADDPKKKKGEADKEDSQETRSAFERMDELREGEENQRDLSSEGFIPGIDGDLTDEAIRDFENVDDFGPDDGFVNQNSDLIPDNDPIEDPAPVAFCARDDLPSPDAATAPPDMSFADALARHDDPSALEQASWDTDDEPPETKGPDIEWDTQPDLLMPYEESRPQASEPVETSFEEPQGVVSGLSPVEDEPELEWPDDPVDEAAVPEEPVTDDGLPTPKDDEFVEVAESVGSQSIDGEDHVEAVGDEIGLPPDMGSVNRATDLDDFDDFDDADDFDDKAVARNPLPTALPRVTAKADKQPESRQSDDDDFDDEFDDEPSQPRRVGNHVNLDLEHLSDIGVITPDNARGKVAEEYRLIKRPLLLNIMGEGEAEIANPNIIMVSSSLPGEGKTFTSVNLAMSMAMELDRTVLLVDADVAKPSFSRVFDMETEGGLIDVLLGDATLEEVLLTTNVPKLRLLPAGRRHANSVELLASEHMKRLTNELATRYENRIIVFDSPPLLATTEAGVLANLMSQIVLVVEANKTPQYVVQESLNILDKSKYIGLVLNKSRSSGRSSYYYDYRYPYYYGYGQ